MRRSIIAANRRRHYTAPPAATTFNPNNGVNKSSAITLSNANKTATGTSTFAWEHVRTIGQASTSFILKITITALDAGNGNFVIGIDNGTTDFGTTHSRPGVDNSAGIMFSFNSTGWSVRANSAVYEFDNHTYSAPYWANGDVIELRGNTGTHTVSLYKNGVKEVTDGALPADFTLPTLASYYGFVGVLINDSLTADFTSF